jgi:hypothetical protein
MLEDTSLPETCWPNWSLLATWRLSEVETGDETQSEAWLSALTSKLTSPNLPLSSFDKGRVDGIVTSLGHKHSFLSLLLPNLFEVFGWGDANNGNQEVKLAPKQMVKTKVSVVLSFMFFFQAKFAALLDTTPDQAKGFLPKHRRFVPGDWNAYNQYVDGVTGTVQRSGTIIPLFNGGFVPQNGRPKVRKELLTELGGDLEARQIRSGYKLVEEDREGW